MQATARNALSCPAHTQYTSAMSIPAAQIAVARKGALELRSVDLPPLAADEVLVKTTTTLISPGTERALLLNLPGLDVTFPKPLGYSHVGVVVAVGAAVDALKAGDRVASRSRHASHAVVKASRCHKLPGELSDEEATFFQLLAIALQAVRKTRLDIGEAAAVMGAGLVGLLALQVCRAAGALPTIVIDADAGRLRRAAALGADETRLARHIDQHDLDANAISSRPPVVIEATGNPAALETACQLAAFGGRVALLGSSRGASSDFDFYKRVHKRGLTLIGAHISTADRLASAPGWWTLHDEQGTALRLIQRGRIAIAPLITHRFHYADFEAAYDLLASWSPEAIGIIIDWTKA